MRAEDDETLNMYVAESLEHLADIENYLLAIEEAGDDFDAEQINKVFRAAHSIKGGAAFLVLNNVKELAHKIETVLELIRSSEIAPNPEIINILLLAFDRLRNLINNVGQSDEIDISEDIEALTDLATTSLPSEERQSVHKMLDICLPNGESVFTVPEFDISQATKGGKFLYLIEYDLIHDIHNKGDAPLHILKEMEKGGIIVESKVGIATVGALEDDSHGNRIPFLVLFASVIDPNMIDALIDIDESRIHLVDERMIVDKSKSKAKETKSPKTTETAEPADTTDESEPAEETGPAWTLVKEVEPDPKVHQSRPLILRSNLSSPKQACVLT